MNKIISKPHLFFFGLVPVFIIISLFSNDNAFTISIEATYFVIPYFPFFIFSAIYFTMIGINYFSLVWADKPPKKWLTTIHILLQILAIILLFTPNILSSFSKYSNSIIVISFLIFLLSAFIHLINFFTSLLLKTE